MAADSDLMTDHGAGVERAAPGEVRVRRALLSVSDKRGIVELAQGLRELGAEIVSTGGTSRELAGAGIAVRAIEDFTGFPEIMDGRVKTLHPRLYAGLLARRDQDEHLRAAAEQGIEPVDLVCVNLYPFEQTLGRGDADDQEIVENIDIGGPTMIRAAAKNSAFAAVLVDPEDYGRVLAELRESGGALSLDTRKRARRQGVRVHRPLRRRDIAWFAARAYERLSRRAGATPTRRSATCATARTRTSRRPSTRAWAPPTHLLAGSRAAARQGAVVQQPARPQLRARAGRGVRRAGLRDRQAQQPVRLRCGSERAGGLRAGLRVRPAERLRRGDRRQPTGRPRLRARSSASSSSRCCSRPATTPPRWRCCG